MRRIGVFCHDIFEFESHMPSHAVGSLWARQASWIELNTLLGERQSPTCQNPSAIISFSRIAHYGTLRQMSRS
jgi:hypothetical protein